MHERGENENYNERQMFDVPRQAKVMRRKKKKKYLRHESVLEVLLALDDDTESAAGSGAQTEPSHAKPQIAHASRAFCIQISHLQRSGRR